jgi:putative endonuclease
MTFWVYILRCADQSYYTGHTDNLEQRIGQHQTRAFPGCYTATRLPIELVFSQPFTTRIEALESEQQIKGWSRKKKEAMMRGDWAKVSQLAISKTTPAIPYKPADNPSTSLRASGEKGIEPSTICAEHPSTSLRVNGAEDLESPE